MDKKYTVYKITNRFDGKIYIGCHLEKKENDRYMGSGLGIKEAIKKYGKKSFKKEIIDRFDNEEEMLAKEKELVTKEFCMREDTYNRIIGGGGYTSVGMVTVVNPDGGYMMVYCEDPRYLTGELKHMNTGRMMPLVTRQALEVLYNNRPNLNEEYKKKISDTLKKKYELGEISHKGEKRSDTFIEECKKRKREEVLNGTDKRCKKIEQYSLNGELIKVWNSIGEAARAGYQKSGIILVCNEKRNRKTCDGYIWKYQ